MLHWEELSGNKSFATIAPGIWFELYVYSSETKVYDNKNNHEIKVSFHCVLRMHSCCFSETKSLESLSTDDKDEYDKNVAYCKKYASIIASSYVGQQHPYRDYPRSL